MMVDEKREGPEGPRADETDQRDQGRDQVEMKRARGWHLPADLGADHATERAERRKLLSGTRAWRTDHTEVMLVELPEPDQFV